MTRENLSDNFLVKLELKQKDREKLQKILREQENNSKDLHDVVKEVFFEFLSIFKNDYRATILSIDNGEFSFVDLHRLNPLIAKLLGNLLVQNEQGSKVISVFDRGRSGSMWNGARYHQTREGGTIHTDNVNIPEIWDYLYLSCLSPGLVGGENILVDGLKIYEILSKEYPSVLKTLETHFIWEMRGVKDSLYEAPIITYDNKGFPLFRHLRPYMESAYIKSGKEMSNDQLFAVDVLDALTNSSENQIRYKLKKGEILLTKDAQVLHGRTCFSDSLEAISFEDYLKGKEGKLKRTMERMWIKSI